MEKRNMVIYTQNPMEKLEKSKSTLLVNHLILTQTIALHCILNG